MGDKEKINFIVRQIIDNISVDVKYCTLSIDVLESIYETIPGVKLIGGVYMTAFPAFHKFIKKYRDAFSIFGIKSEEEDGLIELSYNGKLIKLR